MLYDEISLVFGTPVHRIIRRRHPDRKGSATILERAPLGRGSCDRLEHDLMSKDEEDRGGGRVGCPTSRRVKSGVDRCRQCGTRPRVLVSSPPHYHPSPE